MLTRSEAADVPAELATQRTIAALGLSINQYLKTLQGRQMIESQELFCLNGKLYQGYNQRPIESDFRLCTDAEIENAHDIDGSKQKVVDDRTQHYAATLNAKNRELSDRRRAKIAQERDELELRKLQREETSRLRALDPEPEPDPDPEPEIHACTHPGCGKQFANARGLNAHKMGAKHK